MEIQNQLTSSPDKIQEEYYVPSDEEKADVDLVFKFLEQAKKDREKYDKDWDRWEKYYDGQQWEQQRPAGKAMPVANVIRRTIQSIFPIMTDAKPGFDVLAKTPMDYNFADLLSTLIHGWWGIRAMNNTLVNTIMQCLFYNVGIQKVVWDEELEGGLGDVRVDDIDPRDIFVAKNTIDFDKNCPFVIHRMWKPLGELKRLFPEKAKYITLTGEDKEKQAKRITSYDGNVQVVSPIDKKAKYPLSTDNSSGDSDIVEIYEAWINDNTLVEEDLKDEDGTTKRVSKKRFPLGKIITVTANRVLLQSSGNPRKDGRKPFIRYVDMIRPNRFYGDGEIEQLYEVQKMINRTLALIYDCMNLMGNPVWVVDTSSGVDTDKLSNLVGMIIEKNPGSEVKRDMAPPVPGYIVDFYKEIMKLADETSGIHDVTQGRAPTGITAASAISELQEAAQTRLRPKERNLNTSLTQLGHLIINTMMQYYTTTRVVRVTKKSGWPDFFEFYFKDSEQGTQYVKREYRYDEEQKKYISAQDWLESGYSKGDFDIDVQSGTSLPFAKDKKQQLALSLYDKKAIDQRDLLDKLDWEKRDETIKRMDMAAGMMPQPAPQTIP